MYTYKALIAYDGTHYSGWQTQPNAPSIQATLEGALFRITQTKIPVTGSGRTDAGVHANGQVAHFHTHRPILLKSLNALLPSDIRILSLEEVDPTFHARFSAKEKQYLYHLCRAPIQPPFAHRYTLHYTYPLDEGAIKSAIPHLLGTHDFTSFANELPPHRNPVKTLYEITFDGTTFVFRGNGFLYKMVRNLTGTLLDIGRGHLSPHAIPEILAKKSRPQAGQAAPAHALFLDNVFY